MQIRELSHPITAEALNESLAQKFGYKLNLEQFSDVQLEDARNKLRTKLSQFELEESFDSLHASTDYQKTRAMLDIVNQKLSEREEEKCDDCGKSPCECLEERMEETCDDCGKDPCECSDHKKHTSENMFFATVRKRATDHSVPESWIDSAIQRMSLGETDRSELKAELRTRYDLKESVGSFILLEGEEDKAEIIMASKDMVDRITGWLEDVAQMKAEKLLELLDSIRDTMGSDVAEQYNQKVKPALEAVYSALENSRQGLSAGLATVSGGEAPMMGTSTPPAPTGEPALGMEEPDMGAGSSPNMATPPAPEAGREKRESVDYSRRLGILLASKKK